MASPDHLITLPGGRRLALDDRGDPNGRPVLYLHGTPDSRLARHPDDALAAHLGIRLLAVDRPGIGDSSPDPSATPLSVAGDLVASLDALGLGAVGVLAWSAGAIFALALGGMSPDRVSRLVLAAPLVPADAYGSDGILDGADDSRRMFAGLVGDMTPDELGRELAPFLVPPGCDEVTAVAMLEHSLPRVVSVVGAGEALVAALQASVQQGMTGLERDVAAQAIALGPILSTVGAASVHVGASDTTAPPAMGRWIADQIGATVVEHDAGHELAITHWRALLDEAGRATA